MNNMCSRRWARPGWVGGSKREPQPTVKEQEAKGRALGVLLGVDFFVERRR